MDPEVIEKGNQEELNEEDETLKAESVIITNETEQVDRVTSDSSSQKDVLTPPLEYKVTSENLHEEDDQKLCPEDTVTCGNPHTEDGIKSSLDDLATYENPHEKNDTKSLEDKDHAQDTLVKAVNDEESSVQVLAKYLQNVRNKETHSTFLQDAVVGPFLSLCLASNSDRVVIGVLKVINVLVKNRENLLRLKELLHFTDALLAASENEMIHVSVRNKAGKFHDLIQNSKKPLGNNLDSSNVDKSTDLSSSDCAKPVHSSREIHLHVNHALNKERRFVITRALVKIEGIISVAFNPEQRLCIIRARRARPEVFGLTVANLGFECSLITKNEKKEIVRIPMKSSKAAPENDENTNTPFYFPEDDQEEPAAPNAVAVKGFNQNDGESWWDSAKKLARKSLFW